MKNRIRQRRNRKRKEQMLDIRDICGIRDPTPYEAVRNIIGEKQKERHRKKVICRT